MFNGVCARNRDGLSTGRKRSAALSVDPGLDTIGGNVRRNTYFAALRFFYNVDLSLQKSFSIWESVVTKFRMDAFNAVQPTSTPGQPNGVETLNPVVPSVVKVADAARATTAVRVSSNFPSTFSSNSV